MSKQSKECQQTKGLFRDMIYKIVKTSTSVFQGRKKEGAKNYKG